MAEILFSTVNIFFSLLNILIFIRVILSWVPMNTRANPILAIIYAVTDPILSPIRRAIQKSPLGGRGMMLDFSPIFAFFVLQLVRTFCLYLIAMFMG